METREDNKYTGNTEKPVLSLPQRLMRAFEHFGDLFVLNICFFVTCIPVVTMGAAMTALYTVTIKMTDDIEGEVSKDYFRAFKANLRQGVSIWVIDLLVMGFIISLTSRDFSAPLIGLPRNTVIAVSAILFFLLSLAVPLQFPLLARYDNTVPKIMANALILAIAHPGTWFKLYFIWALPVVIYYMRPDLLAYTWYLWGMILSALFAYICSGFLKEFYKTIEAGERKEEEKEGGKKDEQDSDN